jgi:hypothetical protein
MNHLTTIEVFQIVDETLANGARTKLVAHLERCPRCRQEVEFQRKLLRGARSAPLFRPSAGLREKVLLTVAPPAKKTLFQVVLNNLGNIIAMGMVLTVVWFAASTTNTSSESTQPSVLSKAVKSYVDYYSQAKNFISEKQTQLVGEPAKNPPPKNGNVLYFTLFSVIILVAVDRFVVRKLIRIRV